MIVSATEKQTNRLYVPSLDFSSEWNKLVIGTTGKEVKIYIFIGEDDQSWYWTDEWQAGEKEAIDDFESGRYQEFDTIDSLLTYLHAEREKRKEGCK